MITAVIAFFDPFSSSIGQVILLGFGVLVFGSVYWVLKLSESGTPIRLLVGDEQTEEEP